MKSQLKTHLSENNSDSQSFLEENEQKMSDQCLMVWRLLNQSVRLTVVLAVKYGITSLPRRIKDLRDRNQITTIKDVWVRDHTGKRLFKEWYVEQPKYPTKKETVKRHTKKNDELKNFKQLFE